MDIRRETYCSKGKSYFNVRESQKVEHTTENILRYLNDRLKLVKTKLTAIDLIGKHCRFAICRFKFF